MKKLSIRLRVTLWYAALMILLAAVTQIFMFAAGERLVRTSSENSLIAAVDGNLNEVHVSADQLDDDHLVTFQDGVYLLYYDINGNLLAGSLPAGFEAEAAFQNEAVQTAQSGGYTWYLYDAQRAVKHSDPIWIRGIISSASADTAFGVFQKVAVVALPCLVLLSVLGGYLITGRAFRPIKRITETARQIGDGGDLGRRIALGDGKDEIYALADTFDRMFDRLQSSFDRERRFTSDASHELRTPISVVISQCEYALEHAGSMEEYQAALETVLTQARKMSGMIGQLLELANHSGQGREPLRLEQIHLSELCLMVTEEQKEPAAEKNITIKTEIQPALWLLGDETLLMRLLMNLISNGIRYGRENGTLTVTLRRMGEQLSGSVSDDGIGIPKEHLALIWNRFYQVDPARSGGGAGLGLSMVQWIVQAHGGEISVESEPGTGSTFTFTLPALPVEP
ncbi:MAG: putative two-component histidine kinase [Oscillospiraceae bacterium]|nr:putative two-component histidine kinase [Oscillospiraceae bacterium]